MHTQLRRRASQPLSNAFALRVASSSDLVALYSQLLFGYVLLRYNLLLASLLYGQYENMKNETFHEITNMQHFADRIVEKWFSRETIQLV